MSFLVSKRGGQSPPLYQREVSNLLPCIKERWPISSLVSKRGGQSPSLYQREVANLLLCIKERCPISSLVSKRGGQSPPLYQREVANPLLCIIFPSTVYTQFISEFAKGQLWKRIINLT